MKAYEVIDAEVQKRGISCAELSQRTGITPSFSAGA